MLLAFLLQFNLEGSCSMLGVPKRCYMYHYRLTGLNMEKEDLVVLLFLIINKIIRSIWEKSNSYLELSK